jgi:fructosamine-3-kinase
MKEDLLSQIAAFIGASLKIDAPVSAISHSGGDINMAWKISAGRHTFFAKTNADQHLPDDFYRAETAGLEALRSVGKLMVPRVLETQSKFLLLEWVDNAESPKDFDERFAQAMAQMHRCSSNAFGGCPDNYIGTLPQCNTDTDKWDDFYIHFRLQPLIKRCRDNKRFDAGETRQLEEIYSRISNIFPPEPPSLLHGDLWAGNVMCDRSGQPVFIDPSVYYGHREMDVGMTLLFGGFSVKMHDIYNELFPLENRWRQRVRCAQLYPLLVHSFLFGGDYPRQALAAARYYTG